YPCMDAGSDYMYVTVMFYFAAGGVFDMVVYRSTDGGQVWELVGDFYDEDNINSFYKPSIAATKFGTDYVICAGTYTPDPSDQHFGDIGFAFSVDSGTNWDAYIMPMSNYQRMPYVQEFDVDMFAMSYRQEDGGPTYSTTVIFADTADLTYWEGFEIASDTGAFQASNWFAHVGLMERPDGGVYFSACWSDLRDAAAPITETSDTYVVYSTHGARYTFDTDPTGLDVIVDSVTYATPVMFNWPAGYFHDIEAPTPQTGGGGENYEWDHWSDAGARVHTILADTADVTFTAYYIEMSQFVIPLQEDWNLISLPLIQDDGSINTVLSDIAGLWEYVMVYNTTDADHWKTFSTDKPPQLNDLNELDHRQGFWIYINDVGVDLTVTVAQPT
ncbi:MAG: hypothetical protein KAX31_00075, partial [Thermoplasmata archaeon]|nr:hypothetical protein [Thermoplasmata archaeon]